MRKTLQGYLRVGRPQTGPVPGVRTVFQAEQNAEVIRLGPLGPDEMAEISKLAILGAGGGWDRSALTST